MERRGKKYQDAAKNVEKNKLYSLDEALKLATETSPVKFDASVEIHIRLGVDPRQADQNIRSTVALPHGTGKDVRVAVFAPESEHTAAKKAGADIIGDEEIQSLALLLPTSLKPFLKQKPEKLNIALISKPLFTYQSEKYHSALKNCQKTHAHS